jgi:hypothetical protein
LVDNTPCNDDKAPGWARAVTPGTLDLKGQYVNLDRKYTKLMGLAKRTFALAFLTAGLNRYIGRSWKEKRAAAERERLAAKATRKRRRSSALGDIVAKAGGATTHRKPSRSSPASTAPPSAGPPAAPRRRAAARAGRA